MMLYNKFGAKYFGERPDFEIWKNGSKYTGFGVKMESFDNFRAFSSSERLL